MGLKDSVKGSLLNNVNVKAWVGADNIKRSTMTLRDIFTTFFFAGRAKKGAGTQTLSFDEAMKQYGLSEEDIKKQMKYSLLMLRLYIIFFVLMVVYAFYLLLVQNQLKAALFDFILVLVLASFMFKESFNYFQMKQRRLGCTFKEWLSFLLKRGNAE